MKHIDCGGVFESYEIREHNFCFMKCNKCGQYLSFFTDGTDVQKEINRLMNIKVRPTVRRV